MDFQFEAKGLAEAQRFMQQLPVRVEKNILRGMVRAASKPVADDARSRAPVLKEAIPGRVSGALKRSVRTMSTQLKNGMVKGGVVAGSMKRTLKTAADAFYAKWIEYGRHGQAAQPFLRPAIAAKTPEAIATAARYARERVEAGDLTK